MLSISSLHAFERRSEGCASTSFQQRMRTGCKGENEKWPGQWHGINEQFNFVMLCLNPFGFYLALWSRLAEQLIQALVNRVVTPFIPNSQSKYPLSNTPEHSGTHTDLETLLNYRQAGAHQLFLQGARIQSLDINIKPWTACCNLIFILGQYMKAVRANVPVPYGVSPHIARLGIYVACKFAFACAWDCCQTVCCTLSYWWRICSSEN